MKKILLILIISLSTSVTIAQVDNDSLNKSKMKTNLNVMTSETPEDGWYFGCLYIDGVRQYCIRY